MKLIEKLAEEASVGCSYPIEARDKYLEGYRAALEAACLKAKDLAAHAGAVFNADEILELGEQDE